MLKLKPWAENKTLLKDALETHLNQASYFTSDYFSRDISLESDDRKKELNHELRTATESKKNRLQAS